MLSYHRWAIPLAAAALAGGCATPEPAPIVPAGTTVSVTVSKADAWLAIASAADENRINRLQLAWQSGLSDARRAGFRDAIASEGRLIAVGGALSRPAPTPGSYRCRLVRLGRSTERGPAFEKYKPFFCYVDLEGELFTIVKQTGSSRPAGRLWEDDIPTRLIYLGSLALGNEEEVLAYGDDPKRDMAGIFERIGPFVWRLVIPFPQDGSRLHVYELTPVGWELADALVPLAVWGARHQLGPERTADQRFKPEWSLAVLARQLRSTFPSARSAVVEFHVDGETAHITLSGGDAMLQSGAAGAPADAVVTTDSGTLAALVAGRAPIAEALTDGRLGFTGDEETLVALAAAIPAGDTPPGGPVS